MWAKSLLLSAVLLAGSAAAAEAAQANPRAHAFTIQPNFIMPAQQRGNADIRPLREVVEELRSRFGGDLISARLEDGGRPVYLIRWRMPDGQVRDFRVDAAR
ncbi:MAG TPA: hypothetical protein VEA80_17055 [Vitreimonas sp.]|uniref:PepSY domain-containing protein n=1 Tax=Vitreimonas sp. TaxID=3069702 RepID=UPI002D30A9D7|nr:hypothetical protein [Vitreimonas sp.]HYD89190.1 hypothetical protein [Vitreimonas sp.]